MAFDYYQLQALNAVYKESNFQRAADRLLITQSAVSQRIKALEDSAGEPLLIRSSPPTLTQLGHKYVSAFEQMDALLSSLSSQSRDQESKLSIGVNEESFDTWFNKCAINVSKENNVLFNLFIEDQDQTAKLLREAKVLACISSEKGPIQGCLSYPIKSTDYVCVAHKEFIEKYDLKTKRKSKICSVPTAIYGPDDRIHDKFLAQVLGIKKVPPYKAHTIPSVIGILKQIEYSSVFAVMPKEYVQKYLDDKIFINLFPKITMTQRLYWHVVQTEIPILKKITAEVRSLRGG